MKLRKSAISIILIIAVISGPAVNLAQTALGAEPPGDADEAIRAALSPDSEINELLTREKYAFNRLDALRNPPRTKLSIEAAEGVSELHDLWARIDSQRRNKTEEVLCAIIEADTEIGKQERMEPMLAEMGHWVDVAEGEFRTAKIDPGIFENLRDARDSLRSSYAESVLRLQTAKSRFKNLTGFDMPDGFDFDSAWLLTDVGKVSVDEITGPRPFMFFSQVEGIIPVEQKSDAPDKMVNDAMLELMSLHGAVLNFAKADRAVKENEGKFLMGEIDKYSYYAARLEHVLSALSVYDCRYAYAKSMLTLDKNSGGLVSSKYRKQPARWFYGTERAFGGRVEFDYNWMVITGGEWRLDKAPGDGDELVLHIFAPWMDAANISRAEIHYNGESHSEGKIDDGVVFSPLTYKEDSLIEIWFTDDAGKRVNRASLDGFANAGRFFIYSFSEPVEDTDSESDNADPGPAPVPPPAPAPPHDPGPAPAPPSDPAPAPAPPPVLDDDDDDDDD